MHDETPDLKTYQREWWASQTPEEKEVRNAQARECGRHQRDRFFRMYGQACVLCEEKDRDALSLDHVLGNGGEERRAQGGSQACFRKAIENYRPGEYRVLCRNCQHLERLRLLGEQTTRSREYQQRQRDRLFGMYGSGCVWCGEANRRVLTMDHIQNNGAFERRLLGGNQACLKKAVEKHQPDEYQILCQNCQARKERRRWRGALDAGGMKLCF